ncbi:MAG: hypothetical protein RIR12_582 [Bacteroidota bacterium]
MKEIFLIKNKLEKPTQPVLVLRLGDEHLSYAIADKSNATLHELYYFEVEKYTEDILLHFWHQQASLQQYFYEVQIAFDFKKNSLHPSSLSIENNADWLKNIFGPANDETIITETIEDWSLQNTYLVPASVKHFIDQKFPTAKWRNQFTQQLSAIENAAPILKVEFRQRTFTVLITAHKQLLLAQTFEYTTAADVLYYLLKCCQQFSLSQQTVSVYVTGLIDKDSALYKEMYLYFIQLHLCDVNWITKDEYPAHFFTSLNELFLCA